MAKKDNKNVNQIDMTSFTFLAEKMGSYDAQIDPSKTYRRPCGTCHPGGGILELDREGKRYDKQLVKYPSLTEKLDGDYYQSQWDKTGVIEVDCFICHFSNYNYLKRREQIRQLNYKWASLAGSGIAQVKGAVGNGDILKVEYNKRLFNDDGRMVMAFIRKPSTRNCLFCHFSIDKAKRGTTYNDPVNTYPIVNDVHNVAGLKCMDCHFGNIDHNFAKGDDNHSKVRDDLDNTMKGCIGCHTEGYKGAPRMKHLSIRTDHLDKLSCQACHIPEVSRVPVGATINITGEALKSLNLKISESSNNSIKWEQIFRQEETSLWNPIYEMRKKGKDQHPKIWPVNRILSIFFTNKEADGIHYQLFTSETKEAYESFCKQTNTKKLTSKKQIKLGEIIYKPDDIKVMLEALSKSLKTNKRFSKINPFYHKGGYVYTLDTDGNLSRQKDQTWVGRLAPYSISHNVAPSKKALGANGCSDCHSDTSRIFNAPVVTDLIGENGETLYVRSGSFIGYNSMTILMSGLYGRYLSVVPFLLTILILLIMFIMIQYGFGNSMMMRSVSDFSAYRRFLLRIIITLLLIFVGHIFIFIKSGMIHVIFSLYKKAAAYAGVGGLIFLILGIITFFFWTKKMRFEPDKKGNFQQPIEKDQVFLSIRFISLPAVFVAASGLILLANIQFELPASIIFTASILHGLAATFMLAYLFYTIALKFSERRTQDQ